MILTPDELRSLVDLKHQSPHSLLGMQPLGDGSGLVARALLPDAAKVEIQPVHEKDKPKFELKRIPNTDVFEGVTKDAKKAYAYDFVITNHQGRTRRTRDAFSFLPTLGESDLYLFGKGDKRKIFDKLGAQLRSPDGVAGTSFAVWAPNAQRISVVGDFNNWDGRFHPMRLLGASGVWEIFIPGVGIGAHYKFEIRDAHGNIKLNTDPFGFFFEVAPKQAAIVWDTKKFKWSDDAWLKKRSIQNPFSSPMSIYELHIGSWRKRNQVESLSYRELAEPLAVYLKDMGFTHVEFMPVAEHAFYPSWGYQVTGFFAPTSRFGTPEDFQFLVNALHEAGIGVIVDWVPAHFPRDEWALAKFDGTALFEHEDPRKGAHQDWGTLIFNFGRNEVSNFLVANALFWCARFHIDGLRVDAVASMLYLDYSRKEGQWVPNQFGGRENLEAIEFLKKFNHLTHTEFPGVMTIAEESTAWPQVTRPPYIGGLGFSFKWNMGWMHDILQYAREDPIHRRWHHTLVTFSALYMHSENFILPFSHDEIVHGKRALLDKMPGDLWQKYASLRTLYGYMYGHPGKKLLFMGQEFGQWREWNHDRSLDWHLLDDPAHAAIRRYVQDLNRHYREQPSLHEADFDPAGFRWIDCNDIENSVVSIVRYARDRRDSVVMVFNFTPVPRMDYRIGVPDAGFY